MHTSMFAVVGCPKGNAYAHKCSCWPIREQQKLAFGGQQDLWPVLQLTTRGWSRRSGFFFAELPCCPSFYTVLPTFFHRFICWNNGKWLKKKQVRDGVVLVYWLLVMPVDQVFVFSLYATLTMLVHASVLLCRVESNIDLLKYFLVAEHWFCVWDAVLCWWLVFASSSELVMVYTRVGRFMGVCGCLSLQASLREKQLFFFLSLPPTFFPSSGKAPQWPSAPSLSPHRLNHVWQRRPHLFLYLCWAIMYHQPLVYWSTVCRSVGVMTGM